VSRAAARGVGIYPLGPHYARAQRRGALLLGYAALSEHEIRTGIRLLGDVMAQ
jgi:GntR family transcriptional regulator/MocR family aminotransferase